MVTTSHDRALAKDAADMLAADAQQVAVPQEKDKLCDGLTAGRVMQKAFAWCPTDHPHSWRMQWIADYFIVNTPQPPQAERVPMTDDDLENLWIKSGRDVPYTEFHYAVKMVEAFHGIGIKS